MKYVVEYEITQVGDTPQRSKHNIIKYTVTFTDTQDVPDTTKEFQATIPLGEENLGRISSSLQSLITNAVRQGRTSRGKLELVME